MQWLFLDVQTGVPGGRGSGEPGDALPDVLPQELPPASAHVAGLRVQVPQLCLLRPRSRAGQDPARPPGRR